ncbi:MAG: TIGR02921 family PEP-CTERM protein, partial [Myxococcota bacterium]
AAFARAVRAARAHWSAAAVGVPAGLLAVGIAVVVGLARQPQHMAFALLSGEPATDAARAERLGRSETLRAGLLNAYLWRFRYVGRADEKVAWYTWKAHLGFGLDAAEWVWDVLAAPFQYEPRDGAGDEAFAGLAYADFFDCEIQRCEQDAVLHAVRATWSAEDRAAGALDVGRERVWLSRQEVAVEVDGDVGRFTIHEVYDNQTREEQEIRYTFSLPETAALTGLWLGDRDDLAARIPALLSPRGAAQAVYQRSVRRRVDPALLEQIGPRQYRLRVFPILPEKPMHLWLEGVALAGEHGVPLPVLGERRNVYWTDATERRVDAVPATTDGWLPTHVGRAGEPRSHAFALPDGRRVDATPIAEVGRTPWKGGRYAMVLDRSRSMERRRAEVAEAFDWAREALEPGSTVDLYLTSSASRGEAPVRRAGLAGFDPAAVVWYGALAPDELVAQFASLAGEDCYDAVFVLTDDAARPRDGAPPEVDSPLWMVHLGGAMGPGYDDATTEIVRASGGGAATSLHEAALHASGRTGDTWEADGYRFTVGDGPVEADPAFAPIAAVQRIRALDTPHPDLATLDAVHALATAAHVVTPFTSMIVLPEAWQREALADAEKRSDRFDREVEDDAETLAAPGSISAVPEPATWILGGIGAAILAVRRRLRAV